MDEEEAISDSTSIQSGLHVIYIKYDEDTGYPVADLGDITPYLAISMLQSVIDALEFLLPSPKIIYKNEVLMDPEVFVDPDDGLNES